MKISIEDISINIAQQIKKEILEQHPAADQFYIDDIKENEYLLNVDTDQGESFILTISAAKTKNSLLEITETSLLPEKINNFIKELLKEKRRNDEKKIKFKIDNKRTYIVFLEIRKLNKQNVFDIVNHKKILIDQEIINIIQDAGPEGISATDLTLQTRNFVNKIQRNEIINDLIKKEVISVDFDKSKGRKKKIYKY